MNEYNFSKLSDERKKQLTQQAVNEWRKAKNKCRPEEEIVSFADDTLMSESSAQWLRVWLHTLRCDLCRYEVNREREALCRYGLPQQSILYKIMKALYGFFNESILFKVVLVEASLIIIILLGSLLYVLTEWRETVHINVDKLENDDYMSRRVDVIGKSTIDENYKYVFIIVRGTSPHAQYWKVTDIVQVNKNGQWAGKGSLDWLPVGMEATIEARLSDQPRIYKIDESFSTPPEKGIMSNIVGVRGIEFTADHNLQVATVIQQVHTNINEPKNTVHISINDPENGDDVSYEVNVSGKSEIPEKYKYVFIIVRGTSPPAQYWKVTDIVRVDKDGQWKGKGLLDWLPVGMEATVEARVSDQSEIYKIGQCLFTPPKEGVPSNIVRVRRIQ